MRVESNYLSIRLSFVTIATPVNHTGTGEQQEQEKVAEPYEDWVLLRGGVAGSRAVTVEALATVVGRMFIKYWIYVCGTMFFLVSFEGKVVLYKVVYMVLFLCCVALYQVTRGTATLLLFLLAGLEWETHHLSLPPGAVKLRALARLAEGLLGRCSGLLHVGADPGLHLPVPVVSSHLELLHRTQHSQVEVNRVGEANYCKQPLNICDVSRLEDVGLEKFSVPVLFTKIFIPAAFLLVLHTTHQSNPPPRSHPNGLYFKVCVCVSRCASSTCTTSTSRSCSSPT